MDPSVTEAAGRLVQHDRPATHTRSIVFISLAGVVLPILSLLVESITGICRDAFFDPLPTPFHVALFATIPIANARIVLALRQREYTLTRRWLLLHATSLGVAIFYSIVFLPITPFALLGTLFYGLGALGLAPLAALVCCVVARRAMSTGSHKPNTPFWKGCLLGVALLIAIDSPATITRIGINKAISGSPAERLDGIKWLRVAGSEDLLLQLCYDDSRRATDLLGSIISFNRQVHAEEARMIFYRVTGEPFNSRPAPTRRNPRRWQDDVDADVGGDKVGQRVSDVALIASRMDGSLDADAALGYLEWTMEFKNSSRNQQEGRAEISLPEGATISRATLWINGEEREAAFGGRSQVREAYAKVVSAKRDPLLVTTAGAGRALVQLFPIAPGGTMKIRIGITAPMSEDAQQGLQLELPSFSERNFTLDDGLKHAVWIESKAALQGGNQMSSAAGKDGLSILRGQLAEPLAGQPVHLIRAPGARAAPVVWSDDQNGDDGKVIVQTAKLAPAPLPARVAFVIDGSASMTRVRADLINALAVFPAAVELAVVFADDDEPALFHPGEVDPNSLRRHLENLKFEGGRDNSAALALAWDWAGQTKDGAVVWIHGPQPVDLGTDIKLQQQIERGAGGVVLYDVMSEAGPNRIARTLDGKLALTRIARHGPLAEDLYRLFGRWTPGAMHTVFERVRRDEDNLTGAVKTSAHLARLWAAAEASRLARDPARVADATALAVRYQLVTPVSGAVVLESQEQYDAAGLQPVPPGSVPTIPEPETWMLLIVSLLVLGMYMRRRAR